MLTAVVIGGAACLHDDLARVGLVDLRIGVNDAGYAFPDLNAVATVHFEHVPKWRALREQAGFPPTAWISFDQPPHPTLRPRPVSEPDGVEIWRPPDLTAWVWGSSSLYATGVALFVFGADRVILAGCPLDESPNLYRDELEWAQFQRYRQWWEKVAHVMQGRVYSPSGWTAELLGRPEWVTETMAA